ncbi:hypothetical protein INT47_000086 [Mucor saturninus]|uniref:4-nitrophenylphosphatase n=1 Tax=Mucor saturninus TaxID=64648 RepID=A0A8H7RGD0_9FUNG|nr:hypothetical protein INT47_000086 [Mucor saturninus]
MTVDSDPVMRDTKLDEICQKKGYLIDMDSVIYNGSKLLPGAEELLAFLVEHKKEYLLLTNNSARTPRELQYKFQRLGLNIHADHFFTSGQASAFYLQSETKGGGTVYVIGEPGLCLSLYEKGFYMNDHNPDYVVLGETPNYNFEKITKAIQLVQQGATLIATNLDLASADRRGHTVPCTGAFVACIESVTQKKAFSCGKPNGLMLQYAQSVLGLDPSDTCVIGIERPLDPGVVVSVGDQPSIVLDTVLEISQKSFIK